MPKRVNNIYDKAITFEKLKEAYKRTSKAKKNKRDRIEFDMYLEDYIYKLGTKLKNRTYEVGKYTLFKVYEPKERTIYCLKFSDRVIHQWYIYEFVIPYIVPKFINDSYACIKGKGFQDGVKKLQYYMKVAKRKWKEPYIVKYDISKFFYSIDQKILYDIMKKYYKDKDFLKLTEKFIKFTPEGVYCEDFGLGIPIGNYTSQFFANIYMNELDQYIKHELRVKYYIRFMDDGVLVVESKEKAKEVYNFIEKFVNEKLNLKLNKKSSYFPLSCGVIFCGYSVYPTHILVKSNNIRRMKKRIKKWNRAWEYRDYDFDKWRQSFNSWKGYANYANSYNLLNKLKEESKWLETGDVMG